MIKWHVWTVWCLLLLRKEYTNKHKEIAATEAIVYGLSELLGTQRSSTIEHVQLKQARTVDERAEDEEEVVNEDSDDDDEDEEVVYNPKNLPLGWDGKVNKLVLLKCSISYLIKAKNSIIQLRLS